MTKQTSKSRSPKGGRASGPVRRKSARTSSSSNSAPATSPEPRSTAAPEVPGARAAAVWGLGAREALVQTVDSLLAPIDDPHALGAIAAAQALSGVYAMGARPLFAIELLGGPADLPKKVLTAIARGGAEKAAEAGIAIVGRHATAETQVRYGLAVTGAVHPKRIMGTAGAEAGDVLILTKPIGTGILTAALAQGKLPPRAVRQLLTRLALLDRSAGEVFAARRSQVHALTAVGVQGLLGHVHELVREAGLRAKLYLEQIPVLEGVPALASEGVVPAAAGDNLRRLGRAVRFPRGFPPDIQHVLADPQINGGLLAAVPLRSAPRVLSALEDAGVAAAAIAELVPGRPGIDVE